MDLQRSKHIAALRRLQKCREISASEFEADLEVQTKDQYKLTIRLPQGFPMTAPEIRISPQCTSQCIDAQMLVVKYHDQKVGEVSVAGTWTIHKDVGAMINDIRNTLYFNPPIRGGSRPSHLQPPSGGDVATRNPRQSQSEPSQPHHTPHQNATGFGVHVPPLPTSYPELEKLSTEKLQELLDDEGAFVTFFNDLPLVKKLDALENQLRDENVHLAQANLLQKEPLDKLKEELLGQHEILQVQKHKYDEKQTELQQLVKECSTPKIMERLEQAKAAADTDSRDLQKTFRSGGCEDLEAFIQDYQALRERYHILKFKLEKLKEAP